jgi:DNA-binding MarR family transcriptional regulator
MKEDNALQRGLLPMAKLQIAFLTWKRFFQKVLAPYDITLKQAFVLRRLETNEFLYPSEIASLLFSDRPTVSVIIRNLVKHGWVMQVRDPENRKRRRVNITDEGRDKLAEIKKTPWGSKDPAFDPLGCFDELELQEFDRLLGKLNVNLRQITKQKP